MSCDFREKQYIDFKVYNVTKIKNKYGFRIKLKYTEGNEKIIQKAGFNTKKEANTARDGVITDLYNGTFVLEDDKTVKDYFVYWLESVKKNNITQCSYEAYKNIVYNHIIPDIGQIKLNFLNKGHIQTLYNKKGGYSQSVVKLCKSVIDSALKYALDKKIIRVNVAKNVKLPKNIKKGPYRTIEINPDKTLSIEQLQLLINKSKNSPIYMQVLFASLMGLRRSEINGLKYSDVDYIHRTLKVQRQLGKKVNVDSDKLMKGQVTKQEIGLKTLSSNRELEIPDLLFEAILEERKRYEKNRNRRINDKNNPFKDWGYICCSTYGNPRSKSFHFKYWKQLLKENGLPNIRFHDLRSTYCTLLIKNNFSLKAISQMMGHSTEIISVDVYGDKMKLTEDCLEELEDFIKDVVPEKEELQNDFSTDILCINAMENYIEELEL